MSKINSEIISFIIVSLLFDTSDGYGKIHMQNIRVLYEHEKIKLYEIECEYSIWVCDMIGKLYLVISWLTVYTPFNLLFLYMYINYHI